MLRYLNLKWLIVETEKKGGFRGHELFNVGFMSGVFGFAFFLLGITFAFVSFWLMAPLFVLSIALLLIWFTIGMILDDREALFRRGFDLGLEDRD